jgi:Tat protein translocase TatB subunit
MFGIGTQELIVIFLVAFIFLGPKKLPEIAKSLGKAVRDFRKASSDLKEEIEKEVEDTKEEETNKDLKG